MKLGDKTKQQDFFYANRPEYIKRLPEKRRQRLIDGEKAHKPDMCLECMFFYWVFGKDNRIEHGACTICDGLKIGEPMVRAEGCPLEE